MMQSVLSAGANSDDALHTIRVYRMRERIPRLTRWQTEVVENLNQDVDSSEEHSRPRVDPGFLNETAGTADFAGEPGSTLRFLQERLFEAVTDKVEMDGSVQWVGARDFLQEAEVAAGMVQTILSSRLHELEIRRHRPADSR